jgi:Tfp pilus assembly protein PilZ
MNPTSQGRRKWPRYPARFPVFYSANSDEVECVAHDVSLGGCFVITQRRPKAGERIVVRLDLGDGPPVSVPATVAHTAVNSKTGFGCEFDPLPVEALDRMVAYLSRLAHEQAGRRTAPRVHAEAKARFRGLHIGYAEATTADISEHGLFVITENEPPEAGSLLEFVVDLPDGGPPLLVVGKVVRKVKEARDGKPRGMGVDLPDLDAGGRERLRIFVERALEAGAPAS